MLGEYEAARFDFFLAEGASERLSFLIPRLTEGEASRLAAAKSGIERLLDDAYPPRQTQDFEEALSSLSRLLDDVSYSPSLASERALEEEYKARWEILKSRLSIGTGSGISSPAPLPTQVPEPRLAEYAVMTATASQTGNSLDSSVLEFRRNSLSLGVLLPLGRSSWPYLDLELGYGSSDWPYEFSSSISLHSASTLYARCGLCVRAALMPCVSLNLAFMPEAALALGSITRGRSYPYDTISSLCLLFHYGADFRAGLKVDFNEAFGVGVDGLLSSFSGDPSLGCGFRIYATFHFFPPRGKSPRSRGL
jgi:hypothetical protein